MAFEAGRSDFTVNVTGGTYAPEEIVFGVNAGHTDYRAEPLDGVSVVLEAVVAASTLELWLLKQGADPTNAASWFYSGQSLSGATLSGANFALYAFPGAKVRFKSGGTAGTAKATASARKTAR